MTWPYILAAVASIVVLMLGGEPDSSLKRQDWAFMAIVFTIAATVHMFVG